MKSAVTQPGFFRRRLDWMVGGSRVRWLASGLVLCVVLPWFFSCPLFAVSADLRSYWADYWGGVVLRKIDHPLYDYTRDFRPESNEAKRNFRILVPLVAKVTGTGVTGTNWLRFSLQIVLILSLLLAAERASGDRLVALGTALVVTGTQVGTEVWRDSFGWFDNCAHAFVALALLATGPWLAGLAVLLGLLVDERVMCAVPLIAVFHYVVHGRQSVRIGLALGVVTYLAFRIFLTLVVGLHNPMAGLGTVAVLTTNVPYIPMVYWFSLEGGWLLLVAAAKFAGASKREVAGVFVFTGLALAACTLIGDFTRSATYVFPATLVGLALLARTQRMKQEPKKLRQLVGWAAGISVIVPNGVALDQFSGFESSLPVRALLAWMQNR